MNDKQAFKFKYIDLFSGIGGFHQALSSLGGECVFASEIDPDCVQVYSKNYKINSFHDITKTDAEDIPFHNVLCAGFPCQSFSKAGKREGMYDTRGTLFFEIERILRHHHTKYIILENVRNLVSHDHGVTWSVIRDSLRNLGYRLSEEPIILSPHQFGIPQFRERVYILGVYDPKSTDIPINIAYPDAKNKSANSIHTIIDISVSDPKYDISEYEEYVLNAWNEFYSGVKEKTIGFPIWFDAFFSEELRNDLPEWKLDFIRKNRTLYTSNKEFIDTWAKKYNNLEDFLPTHRKFEWQAGTSINSVWEGIIQMRPSGIRVKKPDVFPSLVAIVQIPIIGFLKRRLTVMECARLQSFPDSFIPSLNDQQAYRQFGNSVNVKIVKFLASKLFEIK